MKMKHIAPIAFALLLLTSCAWENVVPDSGLAAQTRGLMQVEITENDGEGTDKMETVRIIVISDPVGTPKLDFNERFTKDAFTIDDPSGEKAASKLKIVLEVPRKSSGQNEKMVVAIVNEPDGMSSALAAVSTPAQLENLPLEMSTILNSNHTDLKTNLLMPMTGAIWVDRYAYSNTQQEAEQESKIVRLGVSRVVAKVDLFLVNGGTAEMGNITVASGSKATLSNTCTQSPFVYHKEGTRTLGKIQTVASSGLESRSWTSSATLSVPARDKEHPTSADSVLFCTFYTPERTCIATDDADKLMIKIEAAIQGDEGTKSGEIILNQAWKDGISEKITTVGRNNHYRVTATIGMSGITGIVQSWNDQNITQQL